MQSPFSWVLMRGKFIIMCDTDERHILHNANLKSNELFHTHICYHNTITSKKYTQKPQCKCRMWTWWVLRAGPSLGQPRTQRQASSPMISPIFNWETAMHLDPVLGSQTKTLLHNHSHPTKKTQPSNNTRANAQITHIQVQNCKTQLCLLNTYHFTSHMKHTVPDLFNV